MKFLTDVDSMQQAGTATVAVQLKRSNGLTIGETDSDFSIVIKYFGRSNDSCQNYYVEIQLVSYFEFACETRGLNNELNLRSCSNITAV